MAGCYSGVWESESGALVADVLMLSVYILGLCFPCSSPETYPQPLPRPSRQSPAASSAWRRLPPFSRMVCFLAGLGPGSRPPPLPASEQQLPVAGREELLRGQGYSSRNPTDDWNLGL